MDKKLLKLLGGSGKRKTPDGTELWVIPAMELLRARREAHDSCADDPQALGLWLNACVLARAARWDGKRLFESGEQVLKTLPAAVIARWMEIYAALCSEENPSCSEENAQALCRALEQAPYERLKWRVLRAFGVLPTEARARQMTDGAYLYCVAQMMLDEQEKLQMLCPSCREQAEREVCPVCGAAAGEQNAMFDEKRFEELKHAQVHESAFGKADADGGAV